MPLVTLSKILSSKSIARNAQIYPSNSSDCSAQHTGSLTLKTSPRAASSPNGSNKSSAIPKQGRASTGGDRDGTPKAFTFSLDSFNVVASFRTRPKTRSIYPHSEGDLTSRPDSHQSQSAYSGYEDEEYGEPEVDAEEIRRPSGLGRRASLTDITEVGEEVGKYIVDHGSVKEFKPTTEEIKSRDSVGDTSDSESLVEIRYPSGLGNIKLTIPPIEIERPLSTYPHFAPLIVDSDAHVEEDVHTPVPRLPAPTAPRSLSAYLSTILPILTPYVSLQSLASLTLVDRAVGTEARIVLWQRVTMSVTMCSAQAKRMSIDGLISNKILDVINRGDVAHHITSMEIKCRIETTPLASNFSPRSRPPPLVLVPRTAAVRRSGNTLMVPVASTHPQSPPLPSNAITEVQPENAEPTADSTRDTAGEENASPSKMRRASLLLRNSSLTLKNNVPDALRTSAARLRPTSLRLPRRISLFKSRSSEILSLGSTGSTHLFRSQNPSPLSDVKETSIVPFHRESCDRDSEQTTPQEQSDVTDWRQPSSAPLPSTGWSPPSEWYANSSLPPSGPPSSYPNAKQMAHALPRPPSLSSLNQYSGLRLSPSLSSLRARTSLPTRSCYHPEEAPSAIVPSPITPYSAISLSAFPLPPPSLTPPSAPPFPAEYSYSPLPESEKSMLGSVSTGNTPTQGSHTDHVGLPRSLEIALKAMRNLKHVTVEYVLADLGDTGQSQAPYTSMRENINLSLIKKANENLGNIISGLETLRSLKIVCQNTQAEVCRRQWQELTQTLKDFELNVTCLQNIDTNTCLSSA